MLRVGVKYCGGCNPQIDRSRFVDELKAELSGDSHLIACNTGGQWETGILVCGCPVACADRPEVRQTAREWIVVGGQTVEQRAVPERELAAVVASHIKEKQLRRTPHELA
jgi:hypothetical protein